jgi:hypothetical protein
MYMGERLSYYARRQEAFQNPETVWSLIGDGMAQSHCQLPYLGGLKDMDNLTQHLQGMLIHGKLMRVYRTYHNVKHGANMQIHTLLLTIEYLILKSGGKLPETIYYQVDGGSENTARAVMGMAELLVAKGIVHNLVITRLPVGHTHEDIDAKFAKIWVMLRSQHIATMSAYKELIIKALTGTDEKLKMPCEVIDIFVVPDYVSVLETVMDPKFGRYTKLQWTQLQWSFEKVDVCADFPLGVKTLYRAFCKDKVNEIVEDSSVDLGYVCQRCEIEWFPKETATAPAGMFILQRLPFAEIKPDDFVEGSKDQLDQIVNRVVKHYSPIVRTNVQPMQPQVGNPIRLYGDPIVAEWLDFAENIAPKSDDPEEYCQTAAFHVPLRDVLFGDAAAMPYFAQRSIPTKVPVTNAKSTDSVNWTRRGVGRSKNDPAKNSSREMIGIDTDDSDYDGNASSEEDEYDYDVLNAKQKRQAKLFLQYIGQSFRDTDDDGTVTEGLVTDVVVERVKKTICFAYTSKKGEKLHIVADFAVEDCEWITNDDNSTFSDDDATRPATSKPKSKWRGWTEVSPTEPETVALLDQNLVITGKRTRTFAKI